ncbi:MAG: hypothetical protein PVI07_11460 [Anaerolineae bacterium]
MCDDTELQDPARCPRDCPSPTETPAQAAAADRRCGDGACDGPENQEDCPHDCAPSGEATVPADVSDLCLNPNPQRAIVSEELQEWHNWLDDGGFEAGLTPIEISDLPGLSRARAERSSAAARQGSWGYTLSAAPGEGVAFSVKGYTEKGDGIRFSVWARNLDGEVSLQQTVYGMGRTTRYQPEDFHTPDSAFTIGPEWVEVSFETYLRDHEAVLLSLEVGPNATLHIDDIQITQHIWQVAEYPAGESRIVGGIPVPLEPVAPVHFAVLIHIEDPHNLHVSDAYFWEETSRILELARVLHEHGGFLTIQPEEDWAMASERWHPGLLAELVRDFNVVYSTHTQCPHCRDDEGRLRSFSDCKENIETPGWDHEPNSYENPWVVEYVGNLRDLLAEASGSEVTDHNGNWEFAEVGSWPKSPR